MPLTLTYLHGHACPVILCDACGARILDGRDGNYEWESDTNTPTVYFSHKHCTVALRHRHPEIDSWGPLTALPAFLRYNLKLTWKVSENAAAFTESL